MIEDKRSRYRIKYSEKERPRFLLNGYPYEIIDISSGGLRIRAKGEFLLSVGSRINGKVELKNGSVYDVKAKIVRSSKEAVALKLETEIPSRVIFSEERYAARSEDKRSKDSEGHEKRAHYRVKYPEKGEAKFTFNGHPYEITEISSGGLKFNHSDEFKIRVGTKINAQIELKSGYTNKVGVKVMRFYKESVAIKLDVVIPPKVINDEERYILEHYKRK